jgi:methyl-accepting chemotaxis protein
VINPTKASQSYLGKDCLVCHQVPEGTVLGVVSMKVSLDSVESEVASFRLKIIGAALGALGALLVIIYFLTHHFVTEPLDHLRQGLRDIARGEGDLTRRLPVNGNDEVGQAAFVFNEMMSNFQQLVSQVRDAASQVSVRVAALSDSADWFRKARISKTKNPTMRQLPWNNWFPVFPRSRKVQNTFSINRRKVSPVPTKAPAICKPCLAK